MNPLSLRYIIGAAAFAAAMLFAYYQGYSHEKKKFDAFIAQTESVAALQEAVNDHIVKQHERDKEDIHNDYQNRLADLRAQYASRLSSSPRGGQVSAPANTSNGANAATAYNELAAKCAETTLQLTELQEWVRRTVR